MTPFTTIDLQRDAVAFSLALLRTDRTVREQLDGMPVTFEELQHAYDVAGRDNGIADLIDPYLVNRLTATLFLSSVTNLLLSNLEQMLDQHGMSLEAELEELAQVLAAHASCKGGGT